ncbi:hypothetical protein NON08_00015 [Cetobacterium somerae]|uniref:hypothetical protein n=1 Tax=Cetobacterium sp. NK01 TaxID=2993530 RepID=UPI0021164432|nr:hypothetical protein [Cetobacterium sp. NK01]MCQ8210955.1 hypothetical protein [Cetobacterium sp. NK01]
MFEEFEEFKVLIDYLKESSIYSAFEISSIMEFSKRRDKQNLLELNPEKAREAEDLVQYMSKNLKREIKITRDVLERIMLITIVRDYKINFNIDSFDLANLTMIFLSIVYYDTKKEIDKLKEIAVVYNFLHKNMIIDLCEDIGLKENEGMYKLVPIFDLEDFLKESAPKAVITFEDLDLSKYNIDDKIIEFNFPITKYDKLKLKPLIEGVE